MAFNHSHIEVVGNITEDPVIRYTKTSGKAVANFTILVDAPRNENAPEVPEKPSRHKVTLWGKQAENFVESLHLGDRVIVIGRFRTNSWVDETTQQNRTSNYIEADFAAPSLEFAKATIERNPRSNPNPSA